jgi:hypothetical protein
MVQDELRLCGILVGGGAGLYLASYLAHLILSPPPGHQALWLLTLVLNILGYATVLLPGYLALR